VITWQPPSDDGGLPVLGYNIYRSEGAGPPSRIGTADALTYRFNDTYILTGVDYSYFVRAYNELGEGASPRPISYYIEAAPKEGSSSLPLSMSAAVFVLGLGLGTIVMFVLMRRRRKEPEQPLPAYPAQEPVPEQVQAEMYNTLAEGAFDPPGQEVYAEDLPSPYSEVAPESVEPPAMDRPATMDDEIDSLLLPSGDGPTFTDPPLEDPVMNPSGA
jgi:hypothetical protein